MALLSSGRYRIRNEERQKPNHPNSFEVSKFQRTWEVIWLTMGGGEKEQQDICTVEQDKVQRKTTKIIRVIG